MAKYVFQYGEEKVINIHGHAENYQGGTLRAYGQSAGSSFKKIKTRYLQALRTQLASQNAGTTKAEYIQAMDLAKFERMEKAIEVAVVKKYNDAASQASSLIGDYNSAVGALEDALKGTDTQAAAEALNNLLSVFQANESSASVLLGMIQNPNEIQESSVQQVLRLKNFLALIKSSMKKGKDYDVGWLSNALTPTSEALALVIASSAQGMALNQIGNFVATTKGLTGTSGTQIDDGNTFSKAADITFGGEGFNYSAYSKLSDNTLEFMTDMNVQNYASVKAYRNSGPTKMVSYSGQYSQVMPVLHSLYGNGALVDYQIYNTLAFGSGANATLDQNYKIIRGDLINEMAEKYIVGTNQQEVQRILIHNFKAYSMLGIISAIVEQINQVQSAGKREYGYRDGFTIVIERVQNKWYGGYDNNNYAKLKRIREVKAAIYAIKSYGKLNIDNLEKFVEKTDGINIFLN